MKNAFRILLLMALILIFALAWGNAGKSLEDTQILKPANQGIDKNDRSFIDINNIECVTRDGGLPPFNKWKVLYTEKDSEKIKKIIDLVNSCSSRRKSTKEDLDFLKWRHGYPVDIVIKMNDGGTFKLMTAYSINIENSSNGTVVSAVPYKDRFLLVYEKNNNPQYYTVFSDSIADYIRKEPNEDIPKITQ